MAEKVRLPPLWLLGAVALVILTIAANNDNTDVNEYHCYGLDFLYGAHAATSALGSVCLAKIPDMAQIPFHELPREYAPLALVLFTLPALFPVGWYNTIFHLLMCGAMLGVAWLLQREGPRGAGHLSLLYVMLGVMGEAAGRFDALVAATLMVALIASERQRPLLGYGALAVGTLLKFFPAAMLPFLLIQSWRRRDTEPFWRGPALFVAICAAGEAVALAINPARVLQPLTFMGARCVEVESFPATLSYLWSKVVGGSANYHFVKAAGSDCQFSPGLSAASIITLALAGIGIIAILWLVWRERMAIQVGFLLTIGLLIFGTKVFSVQYLLWLCPLVAYVYGLDLVAVIVWSVAMIVTTIYYPLAGNGWVLEYLGPWLLNHIQWLIAFRNFWLILCGALAFRQALRAGQDSERKDFADYMEPTLPAIRAVRVEGLGQSGSEGAL